jgi:hypothetical protein
MGAPPNHTDSRLVRERYLPRAQIRAFEIRFVVTNRAFAIRFVVIAKPDRHEAAHSSPK